MSVLIRVTLRIDTHLVKQFDRLASQRGVSRSAIIREALREHAAQAATQMRRSPADEILPEYSLAGSVPSLRSARFDKSVVTMTRTGRLSIPRRICRSLRISPGTRFAVIAFPGHLALVRVRSPKRPQR